MYFGDKIDSIDFKKGDRVIHKAFGEGTVEDINGDVLIINFDNFGIKKMSNNVKFLTKKDK